MTTARRPVHHPLIRNTGSIPIPSFPHLAVGRSLRRIRALDISEISGIVEDYRKAAERAKARA